MCCKSCVPCVCWPRVVFEQGKSPLLCGTTTLAIPWLSGEPLVSYLLTTLHCDPVFLFDRNLKTLPGGFFTGQQQLVSINLHGSLHLADHEQLPEGLFQGLSALDDFDVSECSFKNLPSLEDLTVGAAPCSKWLCCSLHH